MVLPGFKFEEALGVAQERYPDINFIAIDATPLVGEKEDGTLLYEVAEIRSLSSLQSNKHHS